MLGLKQVILLAGSLSTLALASPLEMRDDNSCTFRVDLVNACKQMYGGSWDVCKDARHTFDIPDCNGVTGKKKICEYHQVAGCKGKFWGGCWNEGDVEPPFAPPPTGC
ncbi:uncharacterized protein MYCFIDRAFT_85323 [Pseudocercospora fijiensis CIRAD86]|uniref:Uncharacterized protein n=1 Tax=Pseudocercospora fijiensis (strain CIRAD86) TaxID=383855 RepID=M3AL72_PSEFD|nr:uncharacterized protein MYCFIDRAFT_85323 [Pseudocercospora fijiensis CIRAD86]EME78192.1 hypothetical protein MYCFIDRAFT_85323 [Pseudocercospora fijiensis CIRAD86]